MMNTLNDQQIKHLISCKKKFIVPPPRFPDISTQNITYRFKVYSIETEEEFFVFFARSAKMSEDFSLGLLCNKFMLYRCNGFHGTTRKGFYSAPHHAYPHAHILSAKDIANGCAQKPSNIENLTGEYFDFPGAVHFFCTKCGIIDYMRYFSHIFQPMLW